ncbi:MULTISPECIES: hypothetical protein [unclassified Halorhabdus]|nr:MULTISPECIES: hypothetical protein [unclassified Halorhabdus]
MAQLTLGQKLVAVVLTLGLNGVMFLFGGILGFFLLIPSILLLGTILFRF